MQVYLAQIIGTANETVGNKVAAYKEDLEKEVLVKVSNLKAKGHPNTFD